MKISNFKKLYLKVKYFFSDIEVIRISKIQKLLYVFYPSSSNFQKLAKLTVADANIFPIKLLDLIQELEIEVKSHQVETDNIISDTSNLFRKYGSDKYKPGISTVYQEIFNKLPSNCRILEIGIGSNDSKMVSNIGAAGIQGASLRAYAEKFPNSEIFGADFDRNTLFQEKNIETFWANQMEIESLESLYKSTGSKPFDLIIDDGLHSPIANINTLIWGLKKIKPSGWIVIEDISIRSVPIWKLIDSLMIKTNYISTLKQVNEKGFLFLIQKRNI
jgi:hypothetical protein